MTETSGVGGSTSVQAPAAGDAKRPAETPGDGGHTPAAIRDVTGDWRDQLGSRRWAAAPLRNPEVEKTDPRVAVAFVLGLAVLTLVIVVVGYTSGAWSLPG